MKLGAVYPTTEVAGDPDAIRTFIRTVEQLGFSHVMAYDHTLKTPHENREPKLTGPYTEKHSFHDPFTFFSFAAGLTDKLGFVTGVLVLPQRQTALVAQQAADVDLFSRERLRLGVGIGWNPIEFAGMGFEFKTRAKRIDEQIGLLRQLWTNPVVAFEGRFDRIDRAGINPRPRRSIPIWLGGYSEPAYERGARLGDGFVFAARGAQAAEGWARVQHHLAALGRDEAAYGRELLTIFASSVEEAADDLKIFRDAGGQLGSITSMGKGFGANIDAHLDFLAQAKQRVDAG